MDFSRFDRHTFISDLARAEDDATAALSRMLSPHFMHGAAWVPGWIFHHGERVRCVERALHASPALALPLLGHQLKDIDLRQVWPILRGVLEDVALYLGGPAALGGALGGGIGLFAGGVGFENTKPDGSLTWESLSPLGYLMFYATGASASGGGLDMGINIGQSGTSRIMNAVTISFPPAGDARFPPP